MREESFQDRIEHISKQGDAFARQGLYEAANVLLTRTQRWSSLKDGASPLPSASACGARRWRSPANWPTCCIVCGATAPSSAGAGRDGGLSGCLRTDPALEVPSWGRGWTRPQQRRRRLRSSPLLRLVRPAYLAVSYGGITPTTNRRAAPATWHPSRLLTNPITESALSSIHLLRNATRYNRSECEARGGQGGDGSEGSGHN